MSLIPRCRSSHDVARPTMSLVPRCRSSHDVVHPTMSFIPRCRSSLDVVHPMACIAPSVDIPAGSWIYQIPLKNDAAIASRRPETGLRRWHDPGQSAPRAVPVPARPICLPGCMSSARRDRPLTHPCPRRHGLGIMASMKDFSTRFTPERRAQFAPRHPCAVHGRSRSRTHQLDTRA
jgi:hypothetical protein